MGPTVVWRLGSFDLSMGVLLVLARPFPLAIYGGESSPSGRDLCSFFEGYDARARHAASVPRKAMAGSTPKAIA